MKKLFLLSLMAFTAIGFTGCGSTSNKLVPKTIIKISDPKTGAAYNLELPKDMEASTISLDKKADGTKLLIEGIKVRTNPEVIGASGVAQADAINAYGRNLNEAFKNGIEAGKELMKKSAPIPIP